MSVHVASRIRYAVPRAAVRPSRSRAMTLVEMIITVCMVGVVLFLLTGWMASLREQAKEDLARRMLADLDEALLRYRRATGCYPLQRDPDSAIPAVIDLLDHEKTRPLLEALPASLWRGPGRRLLIAPLGTELRYIPPDSGDPIVRAHCSRRVFVSAGPDRDFGESNPAALGNNLRSDDPGPDGFRRIHAAVRNAFVEEERGAQGDQQDVEETDR